MPVLVGQEEEREQKLRSSGYSIFIIPLLVLVPFEAAFVRVTGKRVAGERVAGSG